MASAQYAAISNTFLPKPPAKVDINPPENYTAAMGKISGYGKNQKGKKTLKIVLTGDTAVGKTCIIRNYLNNTYSDDYEPTVLDVY